jgi:hypothetical protein
MPFDPDKYLAQKEQLAAGLGFDPDKYLQEKQKQDAPGDTIGAAIEGFGQGASMGYLPELQALAGKLMPDPNAKLDAGLKKMGFDVQQGKETYTQLRDENVKRQDALSKSNPVAYYGSMVGGAVATAPAIEAALTKAAPSLAGLSLAKRAAATGAVMGAAANPGSTEGEIAPIQPLERGKNAVLGAGLGFGLSKLGQAVSSARAALKAPAAAGAAGEVVDDAIPLLQKKINAAKIEAAAKELGVELTPGQLLDDGFLQKLDDMLRESPTMVGRGQANVVKKGVDAATSAAESALEGASNRTAREVGEETNAAIAAKVRAEKAPISAMYDKVRESTQHIEVSPNSVKAIARNVGKLDEANFNGPAKGLVNGAIEDIEKLTNVDQIKKLRTNLRSVLQGTASPSERSAVANIDARLKALEEGTIARAAKTMAKEAKDPALAEELTSLIGERRVADKQYAQFMTKLKDFSGVIKGGRVSTPEAFVQKLEAINPEEFTRKLFTKGNSKGLEFVQEHFPEEAKQIFALEKGKLLSKFTNDGKVRGAALVKEVMNDQKYSPEVRRLMFGEEGLKKLSAAKTYFESLPAKANPSGTAVTQDILSFWGNPIKATGMTARDVLIKGVLNSAKAGDSGAVKGAYKAAMTVKDAGRKALSTLDPIQQRAKLSVIEGVATERKPYVGAERRKLGEGEEPTKGPEKWVRDGFEKLKAQSRDPASLDGIKEKLLSTTKGRELLMQASDLTPGSKGMIHMMERIKAYAASSAD